MQEQRPVKKKKSLPTLLESDRTVCECPLISGVLKSVSASLCAELLGHWQPAAQFCASGKRWSSSPAWCSFLIGIPPSPGFSSSVLITQHRMPAVLKAQGMPNFPLQVCPAEDLSLFPPEGGNFMVGLRFSVSCHSI